MQITQLTKGYKTADGNFHKNCNTYVSPGAVPSFVDRVSMDSDHVILTSLSNKGIFSMIFVVSNFLNTFTCQLYFHSNKIDGCCFFSIIA